MSDKSPSLALEPGTLRSFNESRFEPKHLHPSLALGELPVTSHEDHSLYIILALIPSPDSHLFKYLNKCVFGLLKHIIRNKSL